jgi:hypothetical protein
MDDASKVVPIGGIAALLVVMLKMVWTNDTEQRRNESRLRAEFKIERDSDDVRHLAEINRMRTESDSSLAALKLIHDAELESMNRRIRMLREEAAERLKGT